VLLSGWASYDPEGKPVTYAWSYVSGPASYTITNGNSYNATVSNLVAGTYTFRLTVTDDLEQTAMQDVTFTMNPTASRNVRSGDLSAFGSNRDISRVEVFPNPVTNMLQYRWSSIYRGNAKLTVTDMSGRIFKVVTMTKQHESMLHNVDVSNLKAGIYNLEIRTQEGKKEASRFFKQ
jgi:hypothetical protein